MSISYHAVGIVPNVVSEAIGGAVKAIMDAGLRVPNGLEELLDEQAGDYYEDLGATVDIDEATQEVIGDGSDFLVVDLSKLPANVKKVALVMSY